MVKKDFGSGYFGEWIEDEFGLPAYRYACDQLNDPKAITPMNEAWRSKTDHIHQVGNDRLVGIVSNFGYVQVRQDEGSPKFLNEYDPKNGHYAGGFGYLIDEEDFITTFYPGNGKEFERIFGIGYFRKKVVGKDLIVDQVVFAPYGDDPILISQIKITNNLKTIRDLRWVEYWGCQMYQFSPDAYVFAVREKNVSLARDYRQSFSKKFTHDYKILNEGIGLVETKLFEGQPLKKEKTSPKPVMKDKNPPLTFLLSLDAKVDGLSTSESDFFGKGGVLSPEGIKKPLNSFRDNNKTEAAMFLERKIRLDPNESRTIYFLYGYLPDGFEIENLFYKYKNNLPNIWENSCKSWHENRIDLTVPDESWVKRELLWHNYYLRGAMTYDDYFKEHILSQGQVYQYIFGFQGALRDPIQHVMPFIYSQPSIVKEIVRYIMKTTNSEGEIPYGITGNGMIFPAPYKPSDQQMWLLWLTSEYILATRDFDFLDEKVETYPVYGIKASIMTVKEMLLICGKYLINTFGTGPHGLQRISNGDWNDGVILGHISREKHKEIIQNGESVLNATMATYIFKIFGMLLNFIGDSKDAESFINYAYDQKKAVHVQWNGEWFKRAWLTNEIGWIGEDQLWLEPQPWAIIGGAADSKQAKILIKSIDLLLRKPSKIGAKLLSKGVPAMDRELGMRVNGGIYPSINGTLIWALSLIDGNMAWDEWKKNTLAYHAENYPEIWYGIWSAPDVYNSDLSEYPGQTHFSEDLISWKKNVSTPIYDDTMSINWTDFPVMDLHPHAWPLFNTLHLIGAKFTIEGVNLNPTLPKEEYEFSSPILGLIKSKTGYSGWYAPLTEGTWKMMLKLKKDEIKKISSLEVNGKQTEIVIEEDTILWSGESKMSKPLKWRISI
ncbi:MAG: GH36-type glycosyl hydrolase domain-containing protein [Candidatus Thorarchaeota archaeon]